MRHGSGGVDDDDRRQYLHEFFDDIKQRYNNNNSRCNNRSSIVWSCRGLGMIARIATVSFTLKKIEATSCNLEPA